MDREWGETWAFVFSHDSVLMNFVFIKVSSPILVLDLLGSMRRSIKVVL